MRAKITPATITGENIYVELPGELCLVEGAANWWEPYTGWLSDKYGLGKVLRVYNSEYAPGEWFVEFEGYRSVTLL